MRCVVKKEVNVVLLFSFWFLFDTWSSNFTLMRLIGVSGKALIKTGVLKKEGCSYS